MTTAATGKRDPLISVVVPCYNQGKFLTDCLDSLLQQTFSDWECIVVDDGSTDDSALVAKRFAYADQRFSYRYQQNRGLSAARNEGIRVARGAFLHFLDSDDALLPAALKTFFDKSHDTDLVMAGWHMTRRNLTDIIKTTLPQFDPLTDHLFIELCKSNLFPVHAALLRRSVLETTGIFDEALRSCEDWDLWLRVARCTNRLATIREPLAIYRVRDDSMTRNVSTFFDAGLTVLNRTVRPDARVSQPLADYANGLDRFYDTGKKAWIMRNMGLFLMQKKIEDAAALAGRYELALSKADILFIWKSLLAGAIFSVAETRKAWPRYQATLAEFVQQVSPRDHDAMKDVIQFNAPRITKLFLRIRDRILG